MFLAERALQRIADKSKSFECMDLHVPAGIKISLQSPQFIMGLSANYISPDVSVAFEPKEEKIEAY